jgi:hypothetical protein
MLIRLLATLFVALASVSSAQAGMTVYDLSDVARMRFQEISFFTVLLIGSGLLIRFLWNVVAKSAPGLPKLPFRQAMALTVVLSLGMMLVLTMISGARELLTPGAWRRQGSTYKLNSPENEPTRLRNIAALKAALFDYAERHEGKFPPHDWIPEISAKLWEADPAGARFIYLGGLNTNSTARAMAAEPPNFGDSRYVLTTSGEIKKVSAEEIVAQFASQGH